MGNRNWGLIRQSVMIGASVLVCLALGGAAQANLVQNGTFQTPAIVGGTGGTNFCTPNGSSTCTSLIPDWSSSCVSGTSGGTCQAYDPVINVLAPNPSGQAAFNNYIGLGNPAPFLNVPFAGNIVADDGDSVNFGVPFSQTITGLTTGDSYTLSFYQSADQQNGFFNTYNFNEYWQVSLGSETLNSATMNYPANTLSNPAWAYQSLNFTATSSSEVLSFLAMGPSGVPPVALLGDVNLSQTPEPSYYVATGLGMAALFAFVWRRKRRA